MIQKASILFVLLCFLISAHVYGQAERDTVAYEIKPKMVDQAEINQSKVNESEYYVHVRLKKGYQDEFGLLTSKNIDNYLAVTFDGKVINPKLPVITAEVSQGFSIGMYQNEEKAKEILKRISTETE